MDESVNVRGCGWEGLEVYVLVETVDVVDVLHLDMSFR
jgi:hypothetical protein